MKITSVDLLTLECPDGDSRPQVRFIQVTTDEGIVSRCSTLMTKVEFDRLRPMVVGEDPLEREKLFQTLYFTRHIRRGWSGAFDNCLWDIAGKVAGLPVYSLIGRTRDRFPAYHTGGRRELEGYLADIERGQEASGMQAYKFHSYRNGKEDLPILTGVREAVGPDFALMHDPVCHYTLRDAIKMGHVMEELDFVWLEEPMHEARMDHYQVLCREMTIPIMATETLMHDMVLAGQWLIQGATDLLRANARNGTTQVLKMANFAELHGTNVEINHVAGLYGLIHTHLGCSIANTTYFEAFSPEPDALRKQGEMWGLLNAPLIEDGCLTPADAPGWGAEWDEKRFESLVVARD